MQYRAQRLHIEKLAVALSCRMNAAIVTRICTVQMAYQPFEMLRYLLAVVMRRHRSDSAILLAVVELHLPVGIFVEQPFRGVYVNARDEQRVRMHGKNAVEERIDLIPPRPLAWILPAKRHREGNQPHACITAMRKSQEKWIHRIWNVIRPASEEETRRHRLAVDMDHRTAFRLPYTHLNVSCHRDWFSEFYHLRTRTHTIRRLEIQIERRRRRGQLDLNSSIYDSRVLAVPIPVEPEFALVRLV